VKEGTMAWYWNAFIAVGIFNLVFVLVAWLITVIRERTGSDIPAGGAKLYVRQEYLLNFLQTMHLAEKQKT
jgi:hypothetical protein